MVVIVLGAYKSKVCRPFFFIAYEFFLFNSEGAKHGQQSIERPIIVEVYRPFFLT